MSNAATLTIPRGLFSSSSLLIQPQYGYVSVPHSFCISILDSCFPGPAGSRLRSDASREPLYSMYKPGELLWMVSSE